MQERRTIGTRPSLQDGSVSLETGNLKDFFIGVKTQHNVDEKWIKSGWKGVNDGQKVDEKCMKDRWKVDKKWMKDEWKVDESA